ncbi:MAG: RdgB/HAM1 family non-canonical purine NTP pyrophosphatase [Clostridiales Family XIII bacterium]|jgi:XTP/dITP diphosphohydrolase|nr:RdgB/HAM1 family non-canonical purine NTP pyrophosphatase [Clostridiales Family XIII bacterium]
MLVVAATQNAHKIRELTEITKDFGMEVISRAAAGVPDFEIEEDGAGFEENSLKKARVIMEYCGMAAIADDSGLVTDALGGAPGVLSARFAGVFGADADAANNRKLLALLSDVPDAERTARFVSVVTLVFPGGRALAARGECEGRIGREEKGSGGFGYDPLFTPLGFEKTFAELSAEEKNGISHRARALAALREILSESGGAG